MATDDPAKTDISEPDNLPDPKAPVSKTQRKREADAIRGLGLRLSQLAPSELATVPLPDEILEAINTLSTLKANGARKRQLGFLAKKLRQLDITPVVAAMEQIRLAARASTMTHHLIENWRDRLLGDVSGESASEALTQFLDTYQNADRQLIRQLQRQAINERAGRRAIAARGLFRAIRTAINSDITQ